MCTVHQIHVDKTLTCVKYRDVHGGPGVSSKNIIYLDENVPKKASAGAEEKGQ